MPSRPDAPQPADLSSIRKGEDGELTETSLRFGGCRHLLGVAQLASWMPVPLFSSFSLARKKGERRSTALQGRREERPRRRREMRRTGGLT